ncbi:hypothetical protein ABZV93_04345 [Actinopolymorpha sp. NPDC004070]|uniref:hypothetical protein n=1 Tax=Actinopolymorpha sp. NPDC004070 TaxID=3154548 RepID=UPI0033B3593A
MTQTSFALAGKASTTMPSPSTEIPTTRNRVPGVQQHPSDQAHGVPGSRRQLIRTAYEALPEGGAC